MKYLALLLLLLLLMTPTRADIVCDGVDDQLSTGRALSEFVNAGSYTVMGWVKRGPNITPTGACYEGAFITGDAESYLRLGRRTNTDVCAQAFSEGSILEVPVAAGWHHLAVRLAGGTIRLFVDGVEVDNEPQSNLSDMLSAVSLCHVVGHATPSPDQLAEVAWYNTAVPDGEIATLGRSRVRGMGRTPPTARWPLDQCPDGASGAGVGFVDRSGNNRTATGVNGPLCRASDLLAYPGWGPH